jgi:hypothetical protein
MIFQIVSTSRDMGITVSEFLGLSQDEKAIQIVYSNLMHKIEAVNAKEREDQAKKKSKK